MDATAVSQNSGQAAQGDQSNTPTTPEVQDVVITNLDQLTDAVLSAHQAGAGEEKPTKTYGKRGFKSAGGLDGIPSNYLALMIGLLQYQLALNGGPEARMFLGDDKSRGLLTKFGIQIQAEADSERKIGNYLIVAQDLKIVRNDGESASDFIKRVQSGLASTKA